jgi:16S rRNA (guanine966-N2)-methyltransferase
MRVIAGRLGGRHLSAPRGRTTRPTSDRVREALFSMLGELDGIVALDLFAGTGALGIEALSRGAERAVFVERDAKAVATLRANLTALELGENEANVRVGDALGALRAARARNETYDLVFVDPPYRRARELGSGLSALLPALLSPGARVVVESDRRALAELALHTITRRRYGDTTITIHRLPAKDRDAYGDEGGADDEDEDGDGYRAETEDVK